MSKHATVLVVEDQENERRSIHRALEASGDFRVVSTSSALDAMKYVGDPIDVVLTDLHMGDTSGLDLFNMWKSKKRKTAFIFITGDRDPQQAVAAMKADAVDYLTKPIDVDHLIKTLKSAIR